MRLTFEAIKLIREAVLDGDGEDLERIDTVDRVLEIVLAAQPTERVYRLSTYGGVILLVPVWDSGYWSTSESVASEYEI